MEQIALLPGSFKPPHAGHYNMAKWLASKTNANTVVVKVGSGIRDGITREMSLKLWNLYRITDPDSPKLAILASENNSPVKDVYDFIEQDAPEGSIIYLGIGEKDINDSRYNNINKFAEPKNIEAKVVPVPPQDGGISGEIMRGFIKDNDKVSFFNNLPKHLTPEQKEEAWGIVSSVQEKKSFTKEWWSENLKEVLLNNQATINDQLISLEVMLTPEEQMMGMKGRDTLDGGMLFPYDSAEERSFHMQDCLIPLDIVFIIQGEIINIAPNCPPCSENECPQYKGLADNVLELPGGYCQENNINVGDYIKLPYEEPYGDTSAYRDYWKSNDPGPKTPVEPAYRYKKKNFPFRSMYESRGG